MFAYFEETIDKSVKATCGGCDTWLETNNCTQSKCHVAKTEIASSKGKGWGPISQLLDKN